MRLHPRYLILTLALLALPACQPKSTTEKIEDSVNDALDRRPGEKIRDAAEDAQDAVKDAAEETKDSVKDAAENVKDAVKDAPK